MPAGSRVFPSHVPAGENPDWTRTDLSLVVGSLAGLAVVGALLAQDVARVPEAQAGDSVGRIDGLLGQVLRRDDGTLAWGQVAHGDEVHARDSLYVPPGAFAAVALADGSRLELQERTLVVLEPPTPEGLALRLVKGSLTGFAASPVVLRGGEADALLSPGSSAILAADEGAEARLAVLAGRARVDGADVAPAPGMAPLQAPARHERIYLTRFPGRVMLRWGPADAGLRVEVTAGSAAPADAARLLPAASGEAAFPVPGPGAYDWHLVDERGERRSETRRFFALEDAPPRPVTPRAGEIVLAPAGAQVPFWWTAAPGARHYRLEIAPDPGFASVAFAAESETPGTWVTPDLPEGLYHWRVRVSQPGREGAPWSAPTPFQLIRRPLPEAPQLYAPSIEVDDAAR